MARKARWMGDAPSHCDICHARIGRCFVDGRTKMGPWAIMCTSCHRTKGCGLGMGAGQQYALDVESGDWDKTGG